MARTKEDIELELSKLEAKRKKISAEDRTIADAQTVLYKERNELHIKHFQSKKYIGRFYKWPWLDTFYYVKSFDLENSKFTVIQLPHRNQKKPVSALCETISIEEYHNYMKDWKEIKREVFEKALATFELTIPPLPPEPKVGDRVWCTNYGSGFEKYRYIATVQGADRPYLVSTINAKKLSTGVEYNDIIVRAFKRMVTKNPFKVKEVEHGE